MVNEIGFSIAAGAIAGRATRALKIAKIVPKGKHTKINFGRKFRRNLRNGAIESGLQNYANGRLKGVWNPQNAY